MKATSSSGSMETKLDRVRRQLSLSNLRRRIARTHSDSQAMDNDDVDHLLENCEMNDQVFGNNGDAKTGVASKRSNSTSSESDAFDKYKIPSSLIALTDEEKKRLEYVLVQIGLREVGLG